ncbi:hypothetical protein Pan97_30790 [Bremerella volcania]|uniref:Uncharacterized protein n=1 Tax=Bremerella volcania TaxID=2527984 RepID=A0A518CA25_9BACT|nr:DUF1796 family putative cysteine peptidase [Bremerella volcania]QDU76034.1 hypothetical protein Pan97_30790 [Bremerella volcania]
MPSSQPLFISLGQDCEPAHHIWRLKLPTVRTPFDSARVPDEALRQCLLSDFKRAFSDNSMRVGCYETNLTWGHISYQALSQEMRDRWTWQVNNFLSLKEKQVLFVREVSEVDDLAKQHDEISHWLNEAGYRSFRLALAVKGACERTDRWFPLTREPDEQGVGSWKGSRADWDEFFAHVQQPGQSKKSTLYFRSDVTW